MRLREEKGVPMKRPVFRERECIHQDEGLDGEFYSGTFYIQHLQRLPVDAAVEMASKVSSFFWADAPHIQVWLCHNCAREVGLEAPRAIAQVSRRQA